MPQTTLVLVAGDVDRTRKIYKTIQKHATIVECWGLKPGRDVTSRSARGRPDGRAARAVRRLRRPGSRSSRLRRRLVAERAGTDIARLRGDVERLLLYATGSPKITLEDARQVVSAETAQDDWAVTNAIQRRDAAEALRQLALALEAGGVPYQILGQLAWFVREKLPIADPRRVPAAIEVVVPNRSGLEELRRRPPAGVLLERLVVRS